MVYAVANLSPSFYCNVHFNITKKVRFLSKIFHPNVYGDGKICLDILQNQWSPIYDIVAILTSIQSLLSDPNPASPANSEASTLFEADRREYNRRVRAVVETSWQDDLGEIEEDDSKVSATDEAAAEEAAASADTVFAAPAAAAAAASGAMVADQA